METPSTPALASLPKMTMSSTPTSVMWSCRLPIYYLVIAGKGGREWQRSGAYSGGGLSSMTLVLFFMVLYGQGKT